MKIKAAVTSLGCSKNLVDAEVILGHLKEGGIEVCGELADAKVIIVNTCSFIREAEEESKEAIRQLVALKERGRLGSVIVAGCLTSMRGRLLEEDFTGVDYFLGPHEIPAVASVVRAVATGGSVPDGPEKNEASHGGWFLYDEASPRLRLTPPHYAYVKVSEGCDNRCGYCLIPAIKGPMRSREMRSIVAEAGRLAADGVREINLISQDTTAYGEDLYGASRIEELLERLAAIEGIRWIRLLYGHPARWGDRLLDLIAREPKLCRYVDFPLQHVNDRLLEAMNRPMTKAYILERLRAIRRRIPAAAVRTTFIVGYPGEGVEEFEELLDFVKEVRFEHLGAFIYSPEKGTTAWRLPGQVPHGIKRERFHRLMSLQWKIVRDAGERMVGRVEEVLIDEVVKEGDFALRGRTEADAPEVDGAVYLKRCGARPGDFVMARITAARNYDLFGEVVRVSPCGAAGGRLYAGDRDSESSE